MTITIDPFWLGVIVTIGAEIVAFFLLAIFYAIRNSAKSRGNVSK